MSGAGSNTRWYVLWGALLLSFSAYIERLTVSVVAPKMISDLSVTQQEIGWMLAAFAAGYTIFQLPGGMLGLRYGARKTLFVTSAAAAAAMIMAGFGAEVVSASGVVAIFIAAQLLLGVSQGPLYPVSSGALEEWFPADRWAWLQGLLVTSLGLGAAAAPPALVWLISRMGWRLSVVVASVPGLLAATFWWRCAKDRASLDRKAQSAQWRVVLRDSIDVARNRDVLLLTISYLLDNWAVYLLTFWSFLYLVQERHFSMLEGGWLAGIPFVIGAFGAAIGGRCCDFLCDRLGARTGVRLIPVLILPLAGAFLVLTVVTSNPYTAVASLTASYFCVLMAEGPYWSTAMRIGADRTMATTGVLNTGGNLGGVLSTPLVGYFTSIHEWGLSFACGVVCLLGSAGLWLLVDPARHEHAPSSSEPAAQLENAICD